MIQRIKNRIKSKILYGLKGQPPVIIPDYYLEKYIVEFGISNYFAFDFNSQKVKTLKFVNSMKCKGEFDYKYASTTRKPNIYGSTYVCLLLSLYGELDKLSKEVKTNWVNYFDSFQDEDGYFYDESIRNEIYDNTDWWGKRHLIPHIIMAYTALGAKPKFEFVWLKEFYNTDKIDELLSCVRWDSAIMDDTDIDNKIMNIGVCLQYQRDFWHDENAANAISYLENKLVEKINPTTGFWGNYDTNNPKELARMIQFSYHLQRILFFDNYEFANSEKMIDLILESQNKYGGFAAHLNSSACADIDAIDPLVYLSSKTNYRKGDINIALRKALIFILANQNADGGFVFMRDVAFWYGAKEMSSQVNESAMFPTWFRTHCLAYMCRFFKIGNYKMVRCPGY